MKYLKTILTILVFSLIFFSCTEDEDNDENDYSVAITNCLPSNLQNNIIAYYPFGAGSVKDESGNNRHLTNASSAVSINDRNGNGNCAYEFDTTDSFTLTNATFLNNLPQISISVWFQSADTNGGNFELLIGMENANGLHCPDTFGDFSLSLYDCNRPVFGYEEKSIWGHWNSSWTSCNDSVTYYNANWHHLVATFDTGTLKIYVDGILTAESQNGPCGPTMLNIGDLKIGGYYKGKIDDIIIYDIPLNQTQVSDLFQTTPCCVET